MNQNGIFAFVREENVFSENKLIGIKSVSFACPAAIRFRKGILNGIPDARLVGGGDIDEKPDIAVGIISQVPDVDQQVGRSKGIVDGEIETNGRIPVPSPVGEGLVCFIEAVRIAGDESKDKNQHPNEREYFFHPHKTFNILNIFWIGRSFF